MFFPFGLMATSVSLMVLVEDLSLASVAGPRVYSLISKLCKQGHEPKLGRGHQKGFKYDTTMIHWVYRIPGRVTILKYLEPIKKEQHHPHHVGGPLKPTEMICYIYLRS